MTQTIKVTKPAREVTDSGKVQGRFRSSGERPAILDRLKVHGIELPHSLFEEVVDVNL